MKIKIIISWGPVLISLDYLPGYFIIWLLNWISENVPWYSTHKHTGTQVGINRYTLFFCLLSLFYTEVLVRQKAVISAMVQHASLVLKRSAALSLLPEGAGLVWRHSGAWRFPTCTVDSPLGVIASFNSSSRCGVLSKRRSYLEEEWAQEVRRGDNAITTRQALAPFCHAFFSFQSHRDRPDPFIWHYSTPLCPQATCLQGASIYTAASFYSHNFQMCYGMFLVAARTLHVFSAPGSER